ncbi:MAG: VWA domain-containing protein [Candidatus Riflebacteria bacterium]|nr:VWA domain-containing protein [Candidatus Riflebacteria bacterium]
MLRLASLLLVAMLWSLPAAAPAAEPVCIERIDAGRFPTVTIGFWVAGATVARAPTAAQLKLTEDQVQVREFELTVDSEPLLISLVIDQSGSMTQAMPDLKRAARTFVEELPPGARVQIIAFADRPERLESFTGDRYQLARAIEKLRPYGATALTDALKEGVLDLDRSTEGRRLLVAFTDGRDQNADGTARQSRSTAREVAVLARRARVPLYLIGLGPEVQQVLMQKLARATGGRYYHAPDRAELVDIYRQVAQLLKATFLVRYATPRPAADGTRRTVVLESVGPDLPGMAKGAYRAPSSPTASPSHARAGAAASLKRDKAALPRLGSPADLAVITRLETRLNGELWPGVEHAWRALATAEQAAASGASSTSLARSSLYSASEALSTAWDAQSKVLATELALLPAPVALTVHKAFVGWRVATFRPWHAHWLSLCQAAQVAGPQLEAARLAIEAAWEATDRALAAGEAGLAEGLKRADEAMAHAARAGVEGTRAASVAVEGAARATERAGAALDAAAEATRKAAEAQAAADRASAAATRGDVKGALEGAADATAGERSGPARDDPDRPGHSWR